MRFQHRRFIRLFGLAAVAAAGIATALALTASSAQAYTTADLFNLGYSVLEITLANGCHDWRATPPGAGNRIDIGSDCDPNFNANVDAFIRATCPARLCPVTTTVTNATTQTTVSTSVSTVTTTATVTQPTTVTLPPETQTLPPQTVTTPPVTIIVNHPMPDPPSAAFTVTWDGLTVTLTVAIDATVDWQLGDDTTATGTTISHTYARAGSYQIIATAIAPDGLAATSSQTVSVMEPIRPGAAQ